MALPLPKVVSDVGPGGGLVTAMGGMNSLSNDMLLRQINAVKAQYAPMTSFADASSKLAYARLMGPQFLAKLMGNDSALANMSEDQKRQALGMLYQAGSGQGTGNALAGGMGSDGMQGMPSAPQGTNPLAVPAPQQSFSLTNYLSNKLKGILDQNGQESGAPQQPQNPLQDVYLSGMSPGQSYTNKSPSTQTVIVPGRGADSGYEYDQNGNNIVANPVQAPYSSEPEQTKTYSENTGDFEGNIEQGKKLGELRAEASGELGKDYENLVQSGSAIKHIMNMTQDPIFKNMRANMPFFQDTQLKALAKIGTPQEQQRIGDFNTSISKMVSDTVNSFKGKALEKEFGLANQMKVSPNDTWNVMIGKLGSLETYRQLQMQRNRIADNLITKNHMNRGEAMEAADKRLDGDAIRKQIEGKLNPKPGDEDINYMSKKYNISTDEVKKRLKAKGLI